MQELIYILLHKLCHMIYVPLASCEVSEPFPSSFRCVTLVSPVARLVLVYSDYSFFSLAGMIYYVLIHIICFVTYCLVLTLACECVTV